MKIEELKKLCEEATPGPWGLAREGKVACVDTPKAGSFRSLGFYEKEWATACLMVAACEMLPKLVAVVEAAQTAFFYSERFCPSCDDGIESAPCECFDGEPAKDRLRKALAALEAT